VQVIPEGAGSVKGAGLWFFLLLRHDLGAPDRGVGVKDRPVGADRAAAVVLDAGAVRRTLFGAEEKGGVAAPG
jgi:hypothetical protein